MITHSEMTGSGKKGSWMEKKKKGGNSLSNGLARDREKGTFPQKAVPFSLLHKEKGEGSRGRKGGGRPIVVPGGKSTYAVLKVANHLLLQKGKVVGCEEGEGPWPGHAEPPYLGKRASLFFSERGVSEKEEGGTTLVMSVRALPY